MQTINQRRIPNRRFRTPNDPGDSIYRTIVDKNIDAVCLHTANRIIFANQAYYELFGIDQNSPARLPSTAINPQANMEIDQVNCDLLSGKIHSARYQFTTSCLTGNEFTVDACSKAIEVCNTIAILTNYRPLPSTVLTPFYQREDSFLDALRDTAAVLNSSLEFDTVLERILENVSHVVPNETSQIMLVDNDERNVHIIAVRGYNNPRIEKWLKKISFRIDYTPTLRKMYYECRPIVIPFTSADPDWLPFRESSWIKSYASAPIRIRDSIIGFVNLNSSVPGFFSMDMAHRLQAFSDQAGIAIHNARLLRDLKTSNQALQEAYDKTLLGWSKALELRDDETEYHTLRVVDITTNLARKFGIEKEHLNHVRYGALLHDIGKIAIPDSILLKNGPLSEDEWVIMRRHPDYAYQILSPIPYLAPAINIPLYHHERWDGRGYPRRLREEEIPIEARLFSVVDVWDGLRSDRRYRPGWPEDNVVSYICANAGSHFDPQVVSVFMDTYREYNWGDIPPNPGK